MTPGDVMDRIIDFPHGAHRLPFDDEGIAIGTWGALVQQMKPDQGHMPMSPAEVERAKRILGWIHQSLISAEVRNPSHFRPLKPGDTR